MQHGHLEAVRSVEVTQVLIGDGLEESSQRQNVTDRCVPLGQEVLDYVVQMVRPRKVLVLSPRIHLGSCMEE